jgi:hypothetical protein
VGYGAALPLKMTQLGIARIGRQAALEHGSPEVLEHGLAVSARKAAGESAAQGGLLCE